jgi:DNA polymerase-3 subunit epsilon
MGTLSAANREHFAIVDVETTGFSPARGDRIVEIAIVKLESDGTISSQYHSLVNPGRDPGPTHIHGLSSKHLKHAPTFEEIAGDVLGDLNGNAIVAHNASFDWRFIEAEFNRINVVLPLVDCICTMRLSRLVDQGTTSRKLASLCRHFEIEYSEHHSALSDALATARLLVKLHGILGSNGEHRIDNGNAILRFRGETLVASRKALCREAAMTRRDENFIVALISRLPLGEDFSPECQNYCALLDRVLEDRLVTATEAEQLFDRAQELGLDRSRVEGAHRSYLRQLLELAIRDGTVSQAEANDLREVAELLSIAPAEIEELQRATASTTGRTQIQEESARDSLADKRVCFTGRLTGTLRGRQITRKEAERFAQAKGMLIQKSVTKQTDFLVVADPHSQSAKAESARRLGIRIVAEPAFWLLIGLNAD